MKGFRLFLRYILIKVMSLVPMSAVLDGEDQSVSLTKRLFRAMSLLGLEEHNRIYVFKVGKRYAFSVNPEQLKDTDTNFYTVQYNPQFRTIGFCPTTPSVVRILVESGLPHSYKGKMKVVPHYVKGIIYFAFVP